MRFLFPLGLLVAVFALGPLVAHLLRRQKPADLPFPPAHLVPSANPISRKRSRLEDRLLLLLRLGAIVGLALVAALPLVRCQRLSLDRRAGASVALALVIDDSMSMSAELPQGRRRANARTRFELAVSAARELVTSLRSGDTLTVVLAGSPARVLLPITTEVGRSPAFLEGLQRQGPSDRGTDLDGALRLGALALADAAQPDKRLVVLTDRADGSQRPLELPADARELRLEVPLPELSEPPPGGTGDCGILAAHLVGESARAAVEGEAKLEVRVKLAAVGACGGSLEVVTLDDAARVLGSAAVPSELSSPSAPSSDGARTFEVGVPLTMPAKMGTSATTTSRWLVRLTGHDAIASDDSALVLGTEGSSGAPLLAVVVGEGGALDEMVATGGASVVERALEALQTPVQRRPLPALPDRAGDLSPYAGLIVDDPNGFGPEQREALNKWLGEGGVLLLALGPHAATPPLGSSLEPVLSQPIRWERRAREQARSLIDAEHAGPFGAAVTRDLALDLGWQGRALLAPEDVRRVVSRARWADGPLLLSVASLPRPAGRGEAWIVGLPFAPDLSDLPVMPAFLGLLDAFVHRVGDRGAASRIDVGRAWTLPPPSPGDQLEVQRLDVRGHEVGEVLETENTPEGPRVRPGRVGIFRLRTRRGQTELRDELRAVAPLLSELDLTPRPQTTQAADDQRREGGLSQRELEATSWLMWGLVGLLSIESLARIWALWGARRPDDAVA